MIENEDFEVVAPKTPICERCYLYRALNGTCGCDD